MYELTPNSLLRQLFSTRIEGNELASVTTLSQNKEDFICRSNWYLDWRLICQQERQRQILKKLPQKIGFYTSGHTKKPSLWIRDLQQLFAEVKILGEICQILGVDSVISFAPPYHLYGFLLTYLLPAVYGIPVWFQSANVFQSFHYPEAKRPLLITIPSALTYLERRIEDLERYDSITVVHSTALLPKAGIRLIKKFKSKQIRFIELFGSTETGLIATRSLGVECSWNLAKDVSFIEPDLQGAEIPLRIHTPRLATLLNQTPSQTCMLDDIIRIVESRKFEFLGRRSRLVKVNGQRVNLDDIEETLRGHLQCSDLACLSVYDSFRGESFDLFIVPKSKYSMQLSEIRFLCARVLKKAEQPRKIEVVPQIERSLTGKLIFNQELIA